MNIQVGKTYLITTSEWFYAPDGEQYRAIFGTLKGVVQDDKVLGIKTNRGSTNWYVEIGNILIAGCQIHYCIQTNSVSYKPVERVDVFEGIPKFSTERKSAIYNADEVT